MDAVPPWHVYALGRERTLAVVEAVEWSVRAMGVGWRLRRHG